MGVCIYIYIYIYIYIHIYVCVCVCVCQTGGGGKNRPKMGVRPPRILRGTISHPEVNPPIQSLVQLASTW